MTEPSTAAPETQTPAAAEPAPEPAKLAKKSLEDSLADLDDPTRTFVLGEVQSARSEAKSLRERLRAAEPQLTEYQRLLEASKTEEQRRQEAAEAAVNAANDRVAAANQRVVTSELRAALAGLVDDPTGVIEDLNISRFLTEDGDVDTAAVAALRGKYERFAASTAPPRAPRPDASQASGANGKTNATPADEFASFIQRQVRHTG